jgi:hypothetical protein
MTSVVRNLLRMDCTAPQVSLHVQFLTGLDYERNLVILDYNNFLLQGFVIHMLCYRMQEGQLHFDVIREQ